MPSTQKFTSAVANKMANAISNLSADEKSGADFAQLQTDVEHYYAVQTSVRGYAGLAESVVAESDYNGTAAVQNGTTLGFPLALPSGGRGCILRLDASFRQRVYLPGCPVQVDERLVDAGFAGENGGSPAFRAKLIQPVYEAAIKALSQEPHPKP